MQRGPIPKKPKVAPVVAKEKLDKNTRKMQKLMGNMDLSGNNKNKKAIRDMSDDSDS